MMMGAGVRIMAGVVQVIGARKGEVGRAGGFKTRPMDMLDEGLDTFFACK